MAKKSRRVKKQGKVRLSAAQMVRPVAGEMPATAAILEKSEPQAPDLSKEYHYVIADLKRIGAIALVMLVVLIALALALT